MKICSMLGKLIKMDRVIFMKEFFYYVRILIEVFVKDEFLEIISFENEWGGIFYYFVEYE